MCCESLMLNVNRHQWSITWSINIISCDARLKHQYNRSGPLSTHSSNQLYSPCFVSLIMCQSKLKSKLISSYQQQPPWRGSTRLCLITHTLYTLSLYSKVTITLHFIMNVIVICLHLHKLRVQPAAPSVELYTPLLVTGCYCGAKLRN